MTLTEAVSGTVPTARIVVGVDGSPASLAALRWATTEAVLRDVTVTAVHAWHYPYVGDIAGMAWYVPIQQGLEEEAHAVVERAITAAAPPTEQARIDKVVVQGGAGTALVDAAKGAELLVVGSRGRGGFAGLMLGSVSQQCLHNAPCPIVIIPRSWSGEAAPSVDVQTGGTLARTA